MPDIERPTPADIRRAREAAGLTMAAAAELVHATLRTWQNWEAEGENSRDMPRAAWELFRLKLKARELLERGKIDRATLRRLGLLT